MRDLGRMFRAMLKRQYRVVPWLSIGAVVLALVYVIDPIDFIPDYIPFVGYIDDAVVLGILWRALQRDVKKFLIWEEKQRNPSSPPQLPAMN